MKFISRREWGARPPRDRDGIGRPYGTTIHWGGGSLGDHSHRMGLRRPASLRRRRGLRLRTSFDNHIEKTQHVPAVHQDFHVAEPPHGG